jgi:peptidoglycan/xylan/chitin deacetylase (PgdA/CDA1 family)
MGIARILIHLADKWQATGSVSKPRQPGIPWIRKRGLSTYQILAYHHVDDRADPFFGGIPTAVFRKQMEALAAHFNVLPLQDLLKLASADDLPPRAVAVTLDDGYRDSYLHAFPVFREFGLPATVFLATGGMEKQALLWHDIVFDAFRRTQAPAVSFCGIEYPLGTLENKKAAQLLLRRYLRKVNVAERDSLIRDVTSQLGVGEPCGDFAQMISWQEAREMAEHNITIGAHTVTHPILTRIAPEQALEEIVHSKETIERHLQRDVTLFAYPNGQRDDFNESIKGAVQAAGFAGAVTTMEGINSKRSDIFELRRTIDIGQNPHLLPLKLAWQRLCSPDI